MKIGRNAPCPCNSGKKYKKCCLGKTSIKSTVKTNPPTLRERNLILLEAIACIFGFRRGIEWEDIKREISAEQIRELYKVVATLWPPDTDLTAILPTPGKELRALYLGDVYPELLPRSVFRFGLYADEIFIVDPFHNPWCLARDFNPLEKPDQFKVDTLKIIFFLCLLEPWIRSGIVTLIPDPGDFDYKLRRKTWELSEERHKDWTISREDKEDFEPHLKADFERMVFSMPKEYLVRKMKKWKTDISDDEIENILSYIERRRGDDPLAMNKPFEESGGQLIISRTGANLEMALYIAQLMGAFPYTNIRHRWKELLSVKEELNETAKTWSPLTKAFQNLERRFGWPLLGGHALLLQGFFLLIPCA